MSTVPNQRVLVVDDEAAIRDLVGSYLRNEGFEVDEAVDGEAALTRFAQRPPDLVVLDLRLPGLGGLDVLREIRKRNGAVPVLLLTARDGVDDKVNGLDLGADDYLTKPFAIAELLARVRALTRRRGDVQGTVLSCSDLSVNTATHRVHRGKREISLTAKEYSLLVYLMTREGAVVSQTDIVEKVWDVSLDMFSGVVKVAISRLRKKLEEDGEPPLIHTVRGVGYVLRPGDAKA